MHTDTVHDSLFYRPGAVLSQSELSSARLDGLVFEIGSGYMPADVPEDRSARMTALGPILCPGFAASGSTAAWIHGVGNAPPFQHHIQRVVEHRPRVKTAPNVVVHETRLPPGDIVAIAASHVTSPQRTMTDLVLNADRYPDYFVWMHLLAREMPWLLSEVFERLDHRERIPGRRIALARLERLSAECDQDDVTR